VSCKNKLDVNGDWQDITVVYGLLNQNDSIHYLRITKAFLGPGDALKYAAIPDSSNYPDKLNVWIEEWNITPGVDSTLIKKYNQFDTISIKKDPGDTIFSYPYQKVYYTVGKFDEKYIYKLFIKLKSGKIVSGRTSLIGQMTIKTPSAGSHQAAILPQKPIPLDFLTPVNGKRYQLVLRFTYVELPAKDTLHVDWQVFSDVESNDLNGGQEIQPPFTGDGLYSALKSKIAVNPSVTRHALFVDYILSVGSDDLNTYMNVTAPSTSIVQERPSFTDINNGIGLFTSYYDNTKTNIRHLNIILGTAMSDSLKTNRNTYNLGF